MEMKLIAKAASWFLSGEGTGAYAALSSLEERSVFVYSYLRQIVDESFEEDDILFKTAFLIADALCGSALPYGQYPDVINPAKNPFVAFLKNSKKYKNPTGVFFAYLAILQGVVDPMDKTSWVYETSSYSPVDFEEAMFTAANWKSMNDEEREANEARLRVQKILYEDTGRTMLSHYCLEIPEEMQSIQLKIVWLFGQCLEVC